MRKVLIIGFDGNYGGDLYEIQFAKKISNSACLELHEYRLPRLGGIRTFGNLIKLIFKGFFFQGHVVRPFGMPIFRKDMTIIIHHFDQNGSPIYTRIIEFLDLILLKFFSYFIDLKCIFVSHYWCDWFSKRFKIGSYTIYNDPFPQLPVVHLSKEKLAEKYNLPADKDWIFLGSSHPKKGGAPVVDALMALDGNFKRWPFMLVQTGKGASLPGVAVKWISDADYPDFLRSCSLVVANSLFLEGWCRVVHEAAILGTPVVGSGYGGMAELLSLVSKSSSFSVDQMTSSIFEPALRVKPDISALQSINLQSQTEVSRWMLDIQQ